MPTRFSFRANTCVENKEITLQNELKYAFYCRSRVKQNTGRALCEKFEFIKKWHWGRGGMRSVGYFVSTVGLDGKTILEYVKYQEREGLGQAKPAF